MNLYAGLVLKAAGSYADLVFHLTWLVLGLLLANGLVFLLRSFSLPAWAVFGLTILFILQPATVYFENLMLYTYPTAALLVLSVGVYYRAVVNGRWGYWFLFFLICAAIAFLRTTFHLVWVVAVFILAVLLNYRHYRKIATAFLLPFLLILSLYVKNFILFGFFGASSWFGFNLAIVTTERMSPEEKVERAAEGKLSPVSLLPLYSGVEAYAGLMDLDRRTGIPVLDRRDRQVGRPNFNHYAYIELSRIRMEDNRRYLRERPFDYLSTVGLGVIDYFRPTTRWHPHDPERSPHRNNRAVIGAWENIYNAVVHRFPLPPVGLYLFFPFLLLFVVARALLSAWDHFGEVPATTQLLLLMALTIVYVPAVSCLVTTGELERYRYLTEAMMWAVAAYALSAKSK